MRTPPKIRGAAQDSAWHACSMPQPRLTRPTKRLHQPMHYRTACFLYGLVQQKCCIDNRLPMLKFSHLQPLDDCFPLKDDVVMDIKYAIPANRIDEQRSRPPLIFLHGSFHSAWCWSEICMPYFAQKGYPCIALSMRGTSKTPLGKQEGSKVKIEQHVGGCVVFSRIPQNALLVQR